MSRRALVLSGGGPVGIAWESGIAAGLADAGVFLAGADLIVGTSAGSVVGAQLALGRRPQDMVQAQVARRQAAAESQGSAPASPPDLTPLIEMMMRAYTASGSPEASRAEIGAFALNAKTAPEAAVVANFARMLGSDSWPDRRFVCTAVDAHDGSFVTWDRDSGVEMSRAVASSCSVPGIFPPISLNGRRYIDGGMRSGTNADLARGHDIVVIISLAGGAGTDMRAEMARQRLEREISGLEEGGCAVELIVPDEASRQAIGLNPMDGRRSPDAAEAGARQGKGEASRLRDFWG